MNHSELQEKLFDGHDAEVVIHLQSCLECRAQVDDWTQTVQSFLIPLRTQDNQLFTQNVMREIRGSQAAEKLVRPRFFARWAFPALALSMGSFALVFLYVAQPAAVSADGLFLTDAQTTPSEWVATAASDDPVFGSVVEKP